MSRNPYFQDIAGRYLFQELRERKRAFHEKNPDVHLISLSIGDTTEPLPETIRQALAKKAQEMGTDEGYFGYGPEQGIAPLREKIAEVLYHNTIAADDLFVSDGAKCDIGRLQLLFSKRAKVALQDPAYPAYLDTSILHRGKDSIIRLPCTPENNFFPDLTLAKKADFLFICSPNNPTGHIFTFEELEKLVRFAQKEKKIILFDAAYAYYVQEAQGADGKLFPRSIYEIEGADTVAIEIGSFSKMAGFSGVRLGWTVVPEKLRYPTGEPVKQDWLRIITTFYNGASIISQYGGIAALSPVGLKEMKAIVNFYLENAKLLRAAFEDLDFEVYGGIHSPYLWVRQKGKTSWQLFDELLHNAHIQTTPGVGFGTSGEGFLRISSFGRRATIQEAIGRLHAMHAKM